MAKMDDSQFAQSLEAELTCSICLSTFDCPVTIPCGHNFCQDCLLKTWKDSYSCPQCRTIFATKPELKKNTTLSTVVETFNLKSNKNEINLAAEESKAKKDDVIHCDTCMEVEASQTCLTCLASFCEEHLRPHRENSNFSLHQLSAPVGDLLERICPDHHKLMEFFCCKHGRAICSLCLQQVHKSCSFISPDEQRNINETNFRDKLDLLDGKIEKTETVMLQMNDMQLKLKDAATKKKTAFASVYQQMREMLAKEEREAQRQVDHELDSCQQKMCNLMKRLTENIHNMRKAREDIKDLLSHSQFLSFLQASYDLPKAVKFDPHTPRITLDSNKVMATQGFAAALKEYLTKIFKGPVEVRQLNPKAGELHVSGSTGPQPESELTNPPEQKEQRMSHSPVCPPIKPYLQPVPLPFFIGPPGPWAPTQYTQGQGSQSGPQFKVRPNTKQDRKDHTVPGENKKCEKGSDSRKKRNPRSQSSSRKSTGQS